MANLKGIIDSIRKIMWQRNNQILIKGQEPGLYFLDLRNESKNASAKFIVK